MARPAAQSTLSWSCLALTAWSFASCATLRPTPNPLDTEVDTLRLRGYRVVHKYDGALENNKETYWLAKLDSGHVYELLAACDCDGLSIKVAPMDVGNILAPYHLIGDHIADAYSLPAPRLSLTAPQTRSYLLKIRMSRCASAAQPDVPAPTSAPGCAYRLYVLEHPHGR